MTSGNEHFVMNEPLTLFVDRNIINCMHCSRCNNSQTNGLGTYSNIHLILASPKYSYHHIYLEVTIRPRPLNWLLIKSRTSL